MIAILRSLSLRSGSLRFHHSISSAAGHSLNRSGVSQGTVPHNYNIHNKIKKKNGLKPFFYKFKANPK